VDFYDKRAAHLDPVDNWDKTNGRIFRIEYKGGPKYPTFDLRKKSTAELVELLKHPNVWWRREARQLIVDRGDKTAHPKLRQYLLNEKGQLALESLWALYASGGWMERDFDYVGTHENEYVRAWAIRCLVDDGIVPEQMVRELEQMAGRERNPVVLAQLACSAKRLEPNPAIDIATELLNNPVSADDPQLPLLIWWAMESANSRDTTDTVRFPFAQNVKLQDFFVERTARRFMSGGITRGLQRIGDLYALTSNSEANITPFLRGIATALQAHPLDSVPPALKQPLANLSKMKPKDLLLLEVLARMNDYGARTTLRGIVADPKASDADRVKAADLLRQVRDPRAEELFLSELSVGGSDVVRIGLLGGLEAFDDPQIGRTVLADYAKFSPAVKKRAIQLFITRPVWALPLLQAIDAGKFPKADVTIDHARAAVGLGNKEVTSLVEKHFGKLAPATAGEKQARISWLNVALSREKDADPVRGKVHFTKLCASCHQLHGEGGKVGPDLTTADRKNRGYMLAQIVDPSGYIRPEFVVQNVLTVDERKLSGIATEMGESIVLVTVVNDQPVKTSIAKKDIADIRPSPISLMPEKILDTLSDAQIADLFAYLASEAPKKRLDPVPPSKVGAVKKLNVCLISGSFEYKSDASLAAFQKYLEENFPVACSRAFAKSDKEIAGLDSLEKCDVAIFFTRRLMIDGEMLEPVKKFVKSGKPIIGIRTASHGFQNWLEMDKEVFGGNYQGHYGEKMICDVKIVEKEKSHPVLKGCSPFKTNGSLYKNPNVAADVTVLLSGSIPGQSEPVAWTREKDGRRVFYTSLGHPDDFKDENFTRLLVNALAWTTKTDLKPDK
jgi:putative heme-binding domain-containing protein